MSDTPAAETGIPAPASLGQTLRDRRLQKEITLEQTAQDTKIHIKFLRALEEQRWADFPARVYMEGFFKRYAGYLGLDSEEMVKQLRKVLQETVKPGFSSPAPSEEDVEGRPLAPSSARPLWLFLGGAALVAGLALAYVKMEERRTLAERPVLPEPLSAPVAPPEPPAPVVHEAVVSAKSPVWVRVWVDDQVKFEGILQSGQNKSWTPQKKVRVMSGNAALVTVVVDGQPVGPKPGGPAGEIHWSLEAAPLSLPPQPNKIDAPTPAPDKRQ